MSEPSDQRQALHTGDSHAFSALTEPYRRELQVHCYRILGSVQDAEDLVQETLLRAWRKRATYQGRASLRAWLYGIATHACLDALAARQRPRRTLPMAAGPASDPHAPFSPPIAEPAWLEPLPDDLIDAADAGPEARYSARESVRLAFLVALQALPPRQRAVLILSDVLDWRAREIAELLDVTVSSVNNALHRARATLTSRYHARGVDAATPDGAPAHSLLVRYVRAWENADVDGLTALLKEDATLSMPPSPSWYRGRGAIRAFMANVIFGGAPFPGEARGRWRLQLTRANGQPAFAVYLRSELGVYSAFGIQTLDVDGEQVGGIVNFGDPALVARFGLPPEL